MARKFSLFNNQYINPESLTVISSGVQGIAGLAMMNQSALNAIPQVAQTPEQQTVGRFKAPVYNLGALHTNLADIKAHEVDKGGMATSGVLQGAAAGAVAGVPGAIVGGLLGGIAGLLGGDSAEDEKQRRIKEATERLRSAQMNFNDQNTDSNRNRIAYESYLEMLS